MEYIRVNSSRFVFIFVAACSMLRPFSLTAQTTAPPFTLDKPSSADLTITMKKGTTIQAKAYLDGDKVRADLTMNGMAMTSIIRKDQQKIYQVLAAQKMVMEMPLDPEKFKGYSAVDSAFGDGGDFALIGSDTVNGVACTKYKVTSAKTKQVFFFWLDTARKVPVEMAEDNGSLTVAWKNYQAGPQDPTLFEPPPDYQVISMAGMMGMGGGDAGGD